jgi:hypothetical protein
MRDFKKSFDDESALKKGKVLGKRGRPPKYVKEYQSNKR